jgi:heptosyltransferase-2/heptosyltransferase-3
MRQLARAIIQRLAATWPVSPATPARAELVLLRPDHLGDVLLLLPALERLRRSLPELRIVLVVGPWSQAVVARNPHVDEVLTLPFPGFTRRRPAHPIAPYVQLCRAAVRLRRRGSLAVVVLRDDHWWGAWLSRAAGIAVRAGADHPAVRPYLTHPVHLSTLHSVERNCELLDAIARLLGGQPPTTPVTPTTVPLRWYSWPGSAAEAQALLRAAHIDRPYIAVHPGAGVAVKRWPVPRWIAVGRQLAAAGFALVLTGGPDERELADAIRRGIGEQAVSLAGHTTIPVLAEILRGARLVIGPDSGPLHLAVAVETPTVHLFGPSQPEHFGPWGNPARHRVLDAGWRCPSCGNLDSGRPEGAGCLLAITVDQVLATCWELLGHV